ncbi:DeoR/GlpR family DNA-binding transcription regulator [Tsukamurella sp. 8F]|uniref:DeoR/GlpR family DNA-binding transcription regulator n=1 Tax=unclassified Tsukamurella TaxID=2633480 RepID=UPI0023BA35D4|nr:MULTISPECIES: DeoR/GlpR family DNA-binding transcription regulator [unclassified Tsukamurella]MDF0531521.1 DeoR/GlpR family DNA-binding transcription regulator [Tsukamurella sp. 8J]MDF0588765.1 DeoR/GlpR family DNA-binding transcription regulator [Tsukamurella sp. 8F]
MYAEERQRAIAALVGDHGRASVTDLAERFDVTPETVRRDLAALERTGSVRRVHGGVVAAALLAGVEPGVGEREETNAGAKRAIGAAARRFLPGTGGSVLFDAGTTTAAAARALGPADRLTAITNSLPIATTLASRDGVDLHLIGGRLRGLTHASVGASTVAAIAALRADVAFIGANGLTARHGLSTPDADEASVKSALMRAAQFVVVLADASKFGRESLYSFGALGGIDAIVTDAAPDTELASALEGFGVEVVIAR